MKLEKYPLETSKHLTVYEFVSFGSKGQIRKKIQFSETNLKNIYNLAIGDTNEETGVLDDLAVSDNGDIEKVLSTVVASVLVFTEKNPDSIFYASGSSKSRTKIYQMGISKYFDEIEPLFEI